MLPPKQLTLHIGPGKTGSTALQKSFSIFRTYLAERDHAAVTLQTDLPKIIEFYSPWQSRMKEPDLDWSNYLRLFADKINSLSQSKVIISSEYMAGSMLNKKFLPIEKTRFLTRSFNVKNLIFYIRRQDNMYESIFQQQYKNAETSGFAEFCIKNDPRSLNFLEHLNYIQSLFPETNVIVRPYEYFVSSKDILRDFLESIGFEDIPRGVKSRPSNLSFSDIGLQVLNTSKKELSNEDNHRIRNLLTSDYPQTCPVSIRRYNYLSETQRNSIVDYHLKNNQEIFRRFNIGTEADFNSWNCLYNNNPKHIDSASLTGNLTERTIRFLLETILDLDFRVNK